MVVNVKNGKDMITLDVQLCQIRYCRDPAKHGKIEFLNQTQTTMECFEYLYNKDRERFLSALAEDAGIDIGKPIDPANLRVITEQEYLEVFK